MRKKKKYNLKTRITSALRRIWFYGPNRKEAVKLAKENGNKCSKCKKSFEKLEFDHVENVVPITGFDNWDNYIKRLFEGELVGICHECHKVKTKIAAELRKKFKKIDKVKK